MRITLDDNNDDDDDDIHSLIKEWNDDRCVKTKLEKKYFIDKSSSKTRKEKKFKLEKYHHSIDRLLGFADTFERVRSVISNHLQIECDDNFDNFF